MQPLLDNELQPVLNAVGVGLWSFDLRTGELGLDGTCLSLFGLNEGDPLGPDSLMGRLHPDDVARYRAAIAKAAGSGSFECDYRVLGDDGQTRYISGRGRMQPGSSLVRGICIDVTLSRDLEARLQETELQLQKLADSVPGLLALLDSDFRVRFLNAAYEAWFGQPRTDLLGRHIAEVVGQSMFADRRDTYERVLRGEEYSYEETRTAGDGSERHFSFTYSPYRDASGKVVGLLSLGKDITERRRVEAALEERSRELARSNHDLEQFAYVASHDLKAPLRAIDVLVDWLQEDLAGQDIGDVTANLALLKQRSARLHRLLDDLLSYSRAGRRPGEIRQVDSAELVRDIFCLLAPPAEMRCEADASLPVLVTPHAALEQVLRNLVNNAVKHHPTGSGLVRVSAERRDEYYLFAVEDDGSGIPPQFAEKVFQMFQTLRPRDEVEGSGMGLAIVRRIVESQGGHIWFHPAPGGQGTVFKFTWPEQSTAEASGPGVKDERSPQQVREHSAGRG